MSKLENKDVLIFRTVSIEKMDVVLAECRLYWPDANLVVLSSPNRCTELIDDPRISEVIPIKTGTEGFPRRINLSRIFRAVVVPIGNRCGSVYGNVFTAAIACSARERYIMPYATKLSRITVGTLRLRAALENVILSLSLPLAYLAAALLPRHD